MLLLAERMLLPAQRTEALGQLRAGSDVIGTRTGLIDRPRCPDWTSPSKRVNSSSRYSCAHSARLTLPLVVMGIEPGGTRTRSATLRPCEFDIAEVTSRLTTPSLSIASSSESPRFLSSMMATSFSIHHREPRSPRSGLG